MTYQKSVLKLGLKVDVDALDTSVQLTTEAPKTPNETNYKALSLSWAQTPPHFKHKQKSKLGSQPLSIGPHFHFPNVDQNIQHSRGTELLARKLVGTRENMHKSQWKDYSLSCTSPRLLQLNSVPMKISYTQDK